MITSRVRGPPGGGQTAEPVIVDKIGIEVQTICVTLSTNSKLDAGIDKRLSHSADLHLQILARADPLTVRPEDLDQGLHRHGTGNVEQEHGQQRSLFQRAEVCGPRTHSQGGGPQDREQHKDTSPLGQQILTATASDQEPFCNRTASSLANVTRMLSIDS
ncbi:hypothetical protein OG205_12170 [Lentzea sp. NBC_00516]|uniref:hypothetical protein n=1 Tax=Lentzea sp. NBC_00516 TaxID=2903582 RepID=UPI002E810CF2|nr:hypothetical protein [Lentzea sp. NBC_00516]WUD29958.1 hypothetical protein OG205_12170 [Lentzea sp. NBC_00516]